VDHRREMEVVPDRSDFVHIRDAPIQWNLHQEERKWVQHVLKYAANAGCILVQIACNLMEALGCRNLSFRVIPNDVIGSEVGGESREKE